MKDYVLEKLHAMREAQTDLEKVGVIIYDAHSTCKVKDGERKPCYMVGRNCIGKLAEIAGEKLIEDEFMNEDHKDYEPWWYIVRIGDDLYQGAMEEHV